MSADEAPEIEGDDIAYDVVNLGVLLEIEGEPGRETYRLGEDDAAEVVATIEEYAAAGDVDYQFRLDGVTLNMDGFYHRVEEFGEYLPREVYDQLLSKYEMLAAENAALADKQEALQNDLQAEREEVSELQDEIEELEEQLEEQESLPDYVKSDHYLPREELAGVTFDRIGGYTEQLQELRSLLGDTDGPDFLANLREIDDNTAPVNGILLEGPPGTGKTLAAKAAANELDYEMFLVEGSADLMEKWVGEPANNAKRLMRQARAAAEADHSEGAMVVFDEFDAIARARSSSTGGSQNREELVNQLLSQIDGFADNEDIHMVATTNRKDLLDDAIIRAGRFGHDLSFGYLDDPDDVRAVAQVHFPDAMADTVADTITGTSGYLEENTGADVEAVRNEAVRLFQQRNAEQDGALLDRVQELEVAAYNRGDTGLIDERDAYYNAINTVGQDRAEDLARKDLADQLFTRQAHLAVIPDTIVEEAVHNVYDEDTDLHGDLKSFA